MALSIDKIKVSPCETHHTFQDVPLYLYRFQKILKFHSPGFAAARDATGAFHIKLTGKPAYKARFKQTFGFYCLRAAVETDLGWCHINSKGEPIYQDRYAWCGNYQENVCSVRNSKGNYFHIDVQGERLYLKTYQYVGDFKDGIATVYQENGKSYHINKTGKFVHPYSYQQLDVFHKSFARAKDEKGWFHITKEGLPAYCQRFLEVEPFYNGQAYAQTHNGDLVIINEQGNVIKEIMLNQKNFLNDLSNDLVGFWKSETIKLAIEIGLLDSLPAKADKITEKHGISFSKVERILKALNEIGLVKKIKEEWILTEKGQAFVPTNQSFIAAASQMWSKVQNEWQHLKEKLIDENESRHLTFKELSTNEEELKIYRRSLRGYDLLDFQEISKWLVWQSYSSLVAFGHTGITLLSEILKTYPSIHGIFAHENRPLYHFDIESTFKSRLTQIVIRYDEHWSFKGEAVLMPRFLHYFPDQDVLNILDKTREILSDFGHLYIFEMVLDPETSSGGLLDLNMLAESGGKLRTFHEWKKILDKSGFYINSHRPIKSYLHCIQGIKI